MIGITQSMPARFATKPYAFDHGVLFSIRLDMEVRQVFVGATLFQKHNLGAAKDRERVNYVNDHASVLIEIAKQKAAEHHKEEMVLIDHEDF